MTDNRLGGSALIVGAAASLVTMGLHPSPHGPVAPEQLVSLMALAGAVHVFAIASLPIAFLGALALSRYLSAPDRLAATAAVTYGFAVVAIMVAAAFSGLVGPDVMRRMVTDTPPIGDLWRQLGIYTGLLNRAFAMVFVLLSSAAIFLWSIAIIRGRKLPRSVGIYGIVIAPVTVLAVGSGHVALDVHGFGAVVLLQAIWLISAGASLRRATTE